METFFPVCYVMLQAKAPLKAVFWQTFQYSMHYVVVGKF